MRHVSLNTAELITTLLPETIEKDLMDNEDICPVCKGTGVVFDHAVFGVRENPETGEDPEKRGFPYDKQHIKFCPNCFNGVIKLCEYCKAPLNKMTYKCTCDGYKKHEEKEKELKHNEIMQKAKEISINELSGEYLCNDIEYGGFYSDIEDFIYEYKDLYQVRYSFLSFDEYYEKIPKLLWICEKHEMYIDAYSIVESACEELHEDAMDNISDLNELQRTLNEWTKKQTGTTTLYPAYEKYIKVKKEWFKDDNL